MNGSLFLKSLLAATLCGCSSQANTVAVGSDERACELAKRAVAEAGDFSPSQIAGCDVSLDEETHKRHYVLRLNGYCREEICGSVLLGWYAVDRITAQVSEWDVAEWKLGRPLRKKP
jgi:hypothetical protein